MPSVEGIFLWLSGEIKWWFLIGFLIGLGVFCFKRAWVGAVMFLLGTIFIGMFVVNPQIMLQLPQKFASLLRLS